ncbi:MAG: hypothetical protein KBE09_04140 [Candidatus Pacebacteria bacterium]|nr:hypothetical protein [Candidatus Paceibacterota bacterium]
MTKRLLATALVAAMCAGASWSVAHAACTDGKNRTITVINNSRSTVIEVNATNSRNDSWGSDLLPGTLEPGERATLDMDDGSCRCRMDLRARSASDTKWERFGMDVCSAETWRLGR